MQAHSLNGILLSVCFLYSRIQAKITLREKERWGKRTGKKRELDLRHSCQVVMQRVFRNVAIKVNPSHGGIHFIIPWLSLLYISNSIAFSTCFEEGLEMHWASAEQAWVNADAKELMAQDDSDMIASLSHCATVMAGAWNEPTVTTR